jgi:hypothetical protein
MPRSPPKADGVSERTTMKWNHFLTFRIRRRRTAGSFNYSIQSKIMVFRIDLDRMLGLPCFCLVFWFHEGFLHLGFLR